MLTYSVNRLWTHVCSLKVKVLSLICLLSSLIDKRSFPWPSDSVSTTPKPSWIPEQRTTRLRQKTPGVNVRFTSSALTDCCSTPGWEKQNGYLAMLKIFPCGPWSFERHNCWAQATGGRTLQLLGYRALETHAKKLALCKHAWLVAVNTHCVIFAVLGESID